MRSSIPEYAMTDALPAVDSTAGEIEAGTSLWQDAFYRRRRSLRSPLRVPRHHPDGLFRPRLPSAFHRAGPHPVADDGADHARSGDDAEAQGVYRGGSRAGPFAAADRVPASGTELAGPG